MKKVAVLVIVVSVFLLSIGVFFNTDAPKSSNSPDLEGKHITKAELELLQNKGEATGEVQETNGSAVFISLDDIEKSDDTHGDFTKEIATGKNGQRQNVSNELLSWSENYQNKLFVLVDKNMAQHTANFMKLQMNKNSTHINNSELKQDPAIDENWAYIMEQDIRSLINQHELKAEFDTLNITCKQLSCEILGIEYTPQSWQKIYVSLLTSLPNVVFPRANDPTPTFSINEGERDLVFGRISFKKS